MADKGNTRHEALWLSCRDPSTPIRFTRPQSRARPRRDRTHDPLTKAPHLLQARDQVGPKRQKFGRWKQDRFEFSLLPAYLYLFIYEPFITALIRSHKGCGNNSAA